VFFYEGFIKNHFNIEPQVFILGTITILTILRILFHYSLGEKSTRILLLLAPFMLTSSIAMQLSELYFFENFVYGYIHINPKTFTDLSLLIILQLTLFAHFSTIKKHWKQTLFFSGIMLFFLYVILSWRIREIFYYLDREDGPLEYLTFFLYLASCLISIVLLKIVKNLSIQKRLKYLWIVLLGVSAFLLFLISGEEISWGQRIFNINTPDPFVSYNMQKETTIHNAQFIFSFVYHAYFVLGIYGALSWVLNYIPIKIRGIRISTYLMPILSRWYLAPYFVVIIGYVCWRFTLTDNSFDPWEEASETFLSIGVFLLFLFSYLDIKKIKKGWKMFELILYH